MHIAPLTAADGAEHANHSGSPLRQRWIERLDALGFLHPAA